MKIIPINCPGCGAALKISPDMDVFACGYCGQSLRAVHRGGTVSLQRIADAMARVKNNTDRTASELALRRLDGELRKIRSAQRTAEDCITKLVPEKFKVFDYSWVMGSHLVDEKHFVLGGTMMAIAFGSIWSNKVGWVIFAGTLAVWLVLGSVRLCELKKSNATYHTLVAHAYSELNKLAADEQEILRQIDRHRSVVGSVGQTTS